MGVDGGGTGSRVLITDQSGSPCASAEGEAALLGPMEPEVVVGQATDLILEALTDIPGASSPAAVWLGLAGAGEPSLRVRAEVALRDAFPHSRVGVGTDMEAALQDAVGEAGGILLLAGTGSAAIGRNASGRTARAGGRGSLIGDEGSAYWLGEHALRAVLRAEDGRGPPTRLSPQLLALTGVGEPAGLVAWAAGSGKAEIASLAPLVSTLSAQGDGVAYQLIARAVDELIIHVEALFRELGPWPEPPLVTISGGVLEAKGPMRKGVREALDALDSVVASDATVDAALGAAACARLLMND